MYGIDRGRAAAARAAAARPAGDSPGLVPERGLEMTYLEPGRRRRAWQPRPAAWIVLVLVAVVLAALVLLAQASAGEPGAECQHGAISAIGPVDGHGRGNATAEISCLEP